LVQDVDRTDVRVARYASLAAGAFGTPLSLTLADMLTEGWRGPNPLGAGDDDRSGTARVSVAPPEGPWPFTEVVVSWRLFPVTSARQ
jgi:hypothetical protein